MANCLAQDGESCPAASASRSTGWPASMRSHAPRSLASLPVILVWFRSQDWAEGCPSAQ